MSLTATRRDFLKTSAAMAATAAGSLSITGYGFAMPSEPQTKLSHKAATSQADLLRALGARLGLEAAERVAANGEAVSLLYLDYAGASVDPLREGVAEGLGWHCGESVHVTELNLPYGALLGVAIVRNLETAVETRVEIDATLLSELAMIEANAPSLSVQKHAVMSASADHFYRVTDLA
jgi:TAT (twin-arginine translocation) pathway signal sequence